MKIFNIGLPKTGGNSLVEALRIIGYNAIQSPRKMLRYKNGILDIDYSFVDKYDAFSDIPIHLFYKELDKNFPGSKFILTLRSEDSWLKSTERQFSETRQKLRKYVRGIKGGIYIKNLFGKDVFDFELYRNSFREYYRGIEQYFFNREKDLLYLNVCDEDAWEKICNFLDKPVPSMAFPHKNKKSSLKNILCGDFWKLSFTR